MANYRKDQNRFSCPDSQTCSRKRSIYSNNKIGANYSNYMEHDNCENYSNLLESKNCGVPKSQVNRSNVVCNGNKIQNRTKIEVDSIGSAVGLTCSTTPTVRRCKCPGKESHDRTFAQDFATYLKAFALIYVLPEEEWTTENIDKLLLEGEQLFQICSEDDHADGPLYQSNIYTNIEERVKRKFKLEGHSFTVELKPPYLGEEKIPMEQRPPHIIRNLKTILQAFFLTAHYCLLLYKAGYLLIWRRRKVFFVMDVKGRRPEDFVSTKNGVAMLICLQNINNVVHLISNLSGVTPNDKFSVRELAVVRLVTPDGRVFLRESSSPSVEYKVINQNYAYLTSHLHLSLNPGANLRNRSSLAVGVAAILASKIDHPASWTTCMFDRLICYGVEFCRSCWSENMKDRLSQDLSNFPTQLRLGQFAVEMKLIPKVCTGQWQSSGICSKNNKLQNELRQTLESYGNALIQINSQVYAIWVKDNFYYLLDPYRHTVATPQKRENGTLSSKWATVRMFRDILTMLNVFHQLLKESNRQSTFTLHVVHIKNIVECPQGYSLKPLPEDAIYDVISLNQSIEFPEQLSSCKKLLYDISDYEPDVPTETEEELLIANKFKLVSDGDKDEKNTEEVDLLETANKSANILKNLSRSTSPRGKQLGQIMKPVAGHPQEPKNQTISMSTRKKGVWPAKATGNLSALRMATSGTSDVDQMEIRDRIDASKEPKSNSILLLTCCDKDHKNQIKPKSVKKKCKTNESQTSFESARLPSDMNSINYPIYSKCPHILAIAGSESGTIESLKRLLDYAFKVSNRVLTMTPWGNYVVFKHATLCGDSYLFYLFDGCTCDIDRFRHLDLNFGTAGLLPFKTKSQVICYMIDSRETRASKLLNTNLDDSRRLFEEFMGRGA
ncbi:uncharacterized protein LOC117786646 [Drosophila innubila]|uniref:uncharacterized protein LOC117786646 n=1 Tax=Drosophila innubila TaxID=198719 RepID=UPI00148D3312|nr:uncharacterized protein LOC117786646 [Drosophila innubila]